MRLSEIRMKLEERNLHNAILVSQRAHENQTYNGKPYYDGYILPVVKMTKKLGGDETHQMVAALHDLVENGHTTASSLGTRFNVEVGDAIDVITRDQDDNYFEYIEKVLQNPIAKLVKRAELMIQISRNPPPTLLARYEKALAMIEQN